MDKFIKSLLDSIELSTQRMAHEAQNISQCITAIFGYSAGRESGVQFWLQNQAHLRTPAIHNNQESNGYQEIVSV